MGEMRLEVIVDGGVQRNRLAVPLHWDGALQWTVNLKAFWHWDEALR